MLNCRLTRPWLSRYRRLLPAKFQQRLTLIFHPVLQAAFVAEDVTSIIKESIDTVLQNQQYNHFKVATAYETLCFVICIIVRDAEAPCFRRLVSGLPPALRLASSV